jgi:hypothetical protein
MIMKLHGMFVTKQSVSANLLAIQQRNCFLLVGAEGQSQISKLKKSVNMLNPAIQKH